MIRTRFFKTFMPLRIFLFEFRISLSSLLAIFALVVVTPTRAFDCSVLYDEFDSLMHKDFLITPDNYVPTISGELSYNDFQAAQKGRFHLRKDRPDRGIGIVFTNDKLYGKFIFNWPEPDLFTIEDIIIYNRVEDGYAPVRRGPVPVKTGEMVDLDNAEVMPFSDDEEDTEALRADLTMEFGPVLKTINEARVYFPTTSLCR